MKKLIFGFAALTLLATSCKKDDDAGASGRRATMQDGMWKISASSSIIEYPAPIGSQTVDLYSVLQSCQRDNLFRFNSDGTVTTDEGATKCNSSDPQQTSGGTWSLNGDESQLTVSASGRTVVADITSMSSSSFAIRYVTNENNIKATTTTTYNK